MAVGLLDFKTVVHLHGKAGKRNKFRVLFFWSWAILYYHNLGLELNQISESRVLTFNSAPSSLQPGGMSSLMLMRPWSINPSPACPVEVRNKTPWYLHFSTHETKGEFQPIEVPLLSKACTFENNILTSHEPQSCTVKPSLARLPHCKDVSGLSLGRSLSVRSLHMGFLQALQFQLTIPNMHTVLGYLKTIHVWLWMDKLTTWTGNYIL